MSARPLVTDTGIECIWSRWTYTVHVAVSGAYKAKNGEIYDFRKARCGAQLNTAGACTGVDEHLKRFVQPCKRCFRGVPAE